MMSELFDEEALREQYYRAERVRSYSEGFAVGFAEGFVEEFLKAYDRKFPDEFPENFADILEKSFIESFSEISTEKRSVFIGDYKTICFEKALELMIARGMPEEDAKRILKM